MDPIAIARREARAGRNVIFAYNDPMHPNTLRRIGFPVEQRGDLLIYFDYELGDLRALMVRSIRMAIPTGESDAGRCPYPTLL